MKIAVQLYSIRDRIQSGEDMLNVLGKVKALGYDGVEFAGYQGLDAATLKAKLDEVGLVAIGTHTGMDALKAENIEATLDYHATLGCQDVGVGGGPHGSPEETANSCAILRYANEQAQKRGMRVYYHNHTREFEPFADGSLAMDSFLNAAFVEIDTYWSFCAGVENYGYIKEHQERIIHLHIKDGSGKESRVLGQGDCDIPSVVKAAKEIGLEWLIVENETDSATTSSLDEIGSCLAYLKSVI